MTDHDDLLLSVMIYSTFPDLRTAQELSRQLVEMGAIACANLFPNVTSIYRWRETIEESSEIMVLFKTQESQYKRVAQFIKENHPYETPAILKLSVQDGDADYLRWISEMTMTKGKATKD